MHCCIFSFINSWLFLVLILQTSSAVGANLQDLGCGAIIIVFGKVITIRSNKCDKSHCLMKAQSFSLDLREVVSQWMESFLQLSQFSLWKCEHWLINKEFYNNMHVLKSKHQYYNFKKISWHISYLSPRKFIVSVNL